MPRWKSSRVRYPGQKRWGVDVTLTGDTAAILQALVAAQEPEGGFGLTVGNSDVDLTAMTLQALAPYQNSTVTYTGTSGESVTIREVVRRALAWLSDQQTAEGDFISWDAANLESTAQVIIALCAMLYSGVVTAIIAFALEKTIGWRVTEAQEVGGIDLADQGERAYDFAGTASSVLKEVR